MNSVDRVGGADQGRAVRELDRFRGEFFGCLGRRADELFELLDALLCAEGPVQSLVGLCLAPEHRRGHGALYAAVNRGELDTGRLRETLGALSLPRMFGGRIVLGVDVSPWLRPDAPTCFRAAVLPRLWPRSRGRQRPYAVAYSPALVLQP
jgi:DDE superfamily endonuclease